MGRTGATAAKRKAPSKIAQKDNRQAHFKGKQQQQRKHQVEEEEEEEESADENYMAFNKSAKDSDDEAYGKQKEVFDLNMNDEDDDEEGSEEGSDEDDDDEDDDDLQNLVNNLAPELRNKVLRRQAGADSDEDELDDADADEPSSWGRKKKTYYSGDTADLEIGQDVDDALEEEEAVKDLYHEKMKKMTAQDFLDEDEDDEDAGDDEDINGELSLGAQLAKKDANSKRGGKSKDAVTRQLEAFSSSSAAADEVEVERVAKSVAHLSKEQKLDLLAQQSPELLVIVKDLRDRVEDLTSRVAPIRDLAVKLRAMGKVDDDLVDYLEMKQQLLLAYCLDVLFYLYLKSQGKSLRNHPVMRQMLRLRYAMEKVYSLDSKLKHQVDRLLKLVDQGVDAKSLETSLLKPNLAALLDDEDEDDEGAGRGGAGSSDEDEEQGGSGRGGVYRPPKLSSTPYPADEKTAAKDERSLDRQRKKLQSSELYEALQDEFGTAPEESASGGIANVSADLKKLEKEQADRLAFEEDRFIRMTLTKKDKQAMKRRAAEAMRVDNFEDIGDAGDLEELAELSADRKGKRSADTGAYGSEDAARALERAVRELAHGQDKRQRRAAPVDDEFDAPAAAYGGSDDEDDGENPFDDFVEKKKRFLDKKAEHYTLAPRFGGVDETVEGGDKRAATYEIMKNRGLTPHRKKENRNARVKKREAYAKAVIRRKGAVREAGERADVGYQGELTGIKANLSHSRRLG